MTLIVSRKQVDALGFDLTAAVAAFTIALDHHASTINEPAPTAHPIIEAIVRGHDGSFVVSDDDEPEQSPLTRIPKAEIWRRLTEEEAEVVDAALQAAPLRLRRIFEAAQYLDTGDPDYPALRAGIVAALSEERANEVLTPTY